MATIFDFNKRLQAVDFQQVVMLSIDQTKQGIIEANEQDLEVGLLATSNPITPKYANKYYAKKKFEMNPLAGLGTPDLKYTGNFYAGFTVAVDRSYFTISSTDEKAAQLESRYGKFIYGLTQDAKSAYSLGALRPVLNQNLRNAIGI